jgi:lambda family phage portal protein
MLEKLRKTIAKAIAPQRARAPRKEKPAKRVGQQMQTRTYQAAKGSRLTAGWASSTTSADSELVSSLTALRNRSRALVRDAAYAKRAKVIVQNNVIGAGIGMQGQVMSTRETLREDVNDAIEEAWRDWACAEYCHTGGTLHFCDLERALMGQVFEAGEVFVRKHYRAFGDSKVPFALEMIEAERIADEFTSPVLPAASSGAMIKMGIEVDRYGRPLAYWIRQRHPGELRVSPGESDKIERVPADQIIHLRLTDRWPQTRGEPWLHAVARKLNDMDGYSEAEIVAARGAASYLFMIETPEADTALATAASADEQPELVVEPGTAQRLAPGEKFNPHTPTRPNTALDPFMRYMLREVASGIGVSYESISRDYSQSNYSSSRLALLDDRDLWRMLQQWFLRNFRLPIHQQWLQAAVLARAIAPVRVDEYAADQKKFEAVLFKPRGWGWIDPMKEVEAFEKALKGGFTTRADIIAATADGRDIEDIDRQRAREIEKEKELGLEFTTSPSVYVKEAAGLAPAPAKPKDGKDDGDPPDKDEKDDSETDKPPARLVSFQR